MMIQRQIKARMRRVLIPLFVGGALLLPLLGAEGNSFAATPPPGSPAMGGPPAGVQIAPGVYEYSGTSTSGGGIHPDWTDVCTGNPGWVCFYSPSASATFAYQSGSSPIDYPVESDTTPFTEYDNWVGDRVWLHQYAAPYWNNGWGLCIDPYAGPDPVPGWAQDTADVYISNNTSSC